MILQELASYLLEKYNASVYVSSSSLAATFGRFAISVKSYSDEKLKIKIWLVIRASMKMENTIQ